MFAKVVVFVSSFLTTFQHKQPFYVQNYSNAQVAAALNHPDTFHHNRPMERNMITIACMLHVGAVDDLEGGLQLEGVAVECFDDLVVLPLADLIRNSKRKTDTVSTYTQRCTKDEGGFQY